MKTLSTTPDPNKTVVEEKPIVEPVNSTPKRELEVKEETQDRPLSAEYFNVPDWGKLLLEPKLDAYGLTSKISFIEDYLSSQLKKNSMKNDKNSFSEILSDIERSLGLDEKHDVTHRVSRVYGFLNVIKLAKEKEEIRQKRLISILKK